MIQNLSPFAIISHWIQKSLLNEVLVATSPVWPPPSPPVSSFLQPIIFTNLGIGLAVGFNPPKISGYNGIYHNLFPIWVCLRMGYPLRMAVEKWEKHSGYLVFRQTHIRTGGCFTKFKWQFEQKNDHWDMSHMSWDVLGIQATLFGMYGFWKLGTMFWGVAMIFPNF